MAMLFSDQIFVRADIYIQISVFLGGQQSAQSMRQEYLHSKYSYASATPASRPTRI